jgi:hypothetical protein
MMSSVNARNMQRSLINILYVNKQEFSASSWRSNQGYTKIHGQPIIKIDGFYCVSVLDEVLFVWERRK